MANIAYNNVTFDTTNFNDGTNIFINQFFNLVADENILELKSLSISELFSDGILNKYIKTSMRAHYNLSNLVEMINNQVGSNLTLSDIEGALFAFQRYGLGYYNEDDCDENEVMITGVQSKSDIAFPLFYLFAFLGIKTSVSESLDEYGSWYRKGYQVYLNDDNQLIETENEYQVDIGTDKLVELITNFM